MSLSPDLQKIFPLTFSLMPREEVEAFGAEFNQDWGSTQLHFVPMMFRQKRCPQVWVEAADYEYQKYFLHQNDFSAAKPSAALQIHPSAQFLILEAAAKVLRKAPGMYVLWKSEEGVQERWISASEAAFLDRLREDHVIDQTDLSTSELAIYHELFRIGLVK